MSKIYVFNPHVSLVSATRLAGEGKIKEILGLDKLPAAMKPLLRQAVISTESLNPLAMYKKRVRDYLLRHATRDNFFGWIIDPSKKDVILEQIEKARKEFYEAKRTFLEGYAAACETHIATLRKTCEEEGIDNCEAFINAIRDAQPARDYLDTQIQFSYLRPRLVELEPDELDIVREGVYAQALHEVSQRAEGGLTCQRMTAKRRVAEEIRGKLVGLAYVEPRLSRIAAELAAVLMDIPQGIRNDEYTPAQIMALDGVFGVLANEVQLSAKVAQGDGLFPQPEASPVVDEPQAELLPREVIQETAVNNTVEESYPGGNDSQYESTPEVFYGW